MLTTTMVMLVLSDQLEAEASSEGKAARIMCGNDRKIMGFKPTQP
jgi:hypothetical protein